MRIKIKCPNAECRKALVIDTDMAGKKGRCSTCGAVFTIPAIKKPAGPSQKPAADRPIGQKSDPSPGAARPSSGSAKPRPGGSSRPGSRPAARKPNRPANREEQLDDVEWIEADEIEDFESESLEDYEEDYEAEPPRRSGRPQNRPGSSPRGGAGRARRQPVDDYEDDYEDYDPDDDDDIADDFGPPIRRGGGGGGRSGGRSKKKGGARQQWKLPGGGVLTIAIAACVMAGCWALSSLPQVYAMLTHPTVRSGPNLGFLQGSGQTILTLIKLREVLWVGSMVALITGYIFLLFAPKGRGNSQGLIIAALVLGVIDFFTRLFMFSLPILTEGRAGSFMGFGGGGFGGPSTFSVLFQLSLFEIFFIAEMIVLALAFAEINRQLSDRHNEDDARGLLKPMIAYGGTVLAQGLFLLLVKTLAEDSTSPPSEGMANMILWCFYLLRFAYFGMLTWFFIAWIRVSFNTKTAIP